jgi:hypothetical protein
VTNGPAGQGGGGAISKQTILSLYVPAVMLSLGEGIAAPVLPQLAKSFDISLGGAASSRPSPLAIWLTASAGVR